MLLGMLLVSWQGAGAQGGNMVRFSATRFDAMSAFYADNTEHGRATLITSDSVLHTAHILVDYTLRAAELTHLDKDLRTLTATMLARSAKQAQDEAARRYVMAPPPYGYTRVAAYFGVAQQLLNPKAAMPEIIRPLVAKEVALILAHQGQTVSPITGVFEDYTQYVPRGHYTRNEAFMRYFRAMMWYGRAGFAISGEKAPGIKLSRDEARANAWAGIVLARDLAEPVTLKLWQAIYRPTGFIVGLSDDLTPPEYAALSRQVLGDTLPGGWTPDAQARTDRFITQAIALRPPQILGTVQSDNEAAPPVAVRFFGQRYTPDSAVFQRLVHASVPNRFMPTGLDVMAALGSPEAEARLRARGEFTKYPGYGAQLAKVQREIAGWDDAWQRTAYLLWLRAIRDLVNEQPGPTDATRRQTLPAWWTSPAWQAKQLNAGLGSWAELRHDTILYVKQSYTAWAMAMPMPAPRPVLYVEPVPKVYAGVRMLLSTLRQTLTQEGVFPAELGANYDQFNRLLRVLYVTSMQERYPGLEMMKPLDARDVGLLPKIGDVLAEVETLPEPLRAQLTGQEDVQMAIIADVHTDPNAGQVLEVGVGRVLAVTAPVTIDGRTIEVSGPIFSYYEFAQPMAKRLTDGAWQEMLRAGNAAKPFVLGAYMK
jgi:hypothetical protein